MPTRGHSVREPEPAGNLSAQLTRACARVVSSVVVQVSAEIVKPLADRPYEGFLVISTEISPMASSSYEAGRCVLAPHPVFLRRARVLTPVDVGLRTRRSFSRGFSKRRCARARPWTGRRCASWPGRRCGLPLPARGPVYALRSLAHDKSQVWSIRVDVHFLDDEGNMLDCASIAAITALRHFRRPDVTVIGEEVTVVSQSAPDGCRAERSGADVRDFVRQHSMTERVPVPLAIHHSPFCQTFAFFGEECVESMSLDGAFSYDVPSPGPSACSTRRISSRCSLPGHLPSH